MLEQMEKPIPEADPVAYARMKYEQENRTKASLFSRTIGPVFSKSPDVRMAAKSGTPPADGLRPTTPASVPVAAPAAPPGRAGGDGAIQQVTHSNAAHHGPEAPPKPPPA